MVFLFFLTLFYIVFSITCCSVFYLLPQAAPHGADYPTIEFRFIRTVTDSSMEKVNSFFYIVKIADHIKSLYDWRHFPLAFNRRYCARDSSAILVISISRCPLPRSFSSSLMRYSLPVFFTTSKFLPSICAQL